MAERYLRRHNGRHPFYSSYSILLPLLLIVSLLVSGCGGGNGEEAQAKTPSSPEHTSGTPAGKPSAKPSEEPSAGSSGEPSSEPAGDEPEESAPLRDNTPQVFTPEAPGTASFGNDIVTMDLSNVSKGYMILTYHGSNEKVKFQVKGPDDVTCTYLVSARGEPVVYPLTGGDGSYSFVLLESADLSQDLYAIAYTQAMDVTIEDEFLPYLTPNVYVDYRADSQAVAKGRDLAEGCHNDLEVVQHIYSYVTNNITYDTAKAENVAYGYTPNVDETLSTGKGICFDYASLMSCMLRSQRIPSRLEVGYAGDIYHAWISCYLTETGWVDRIIEFDGKSWSLMDPTLAAARDSEQVRQYIGDGSKYTVKYTY